MVGKDVVWSTSVVGLIFCVVLGVLCLLFALSGRSRVESLRGACVGAEGEAEGSGVVGQVVEVVPAGDLAGWLKSHGGVRISCVSGLGRGFDGYDNSYLVVYSEGSFDGQRRVVLDVGDLDGWLSEHRGKVRLVAFTALGEGFRGSPVGYLVVYELE